jgi:hypothetical protein
MKPMTAKLPPIRTIPRASSVRRRDVAAAVKAVIALRDARTRRYLAAANEQKVSEPHK